MINRKKIYGNDNILNKKIFSDIICFSHLRWNFVYQRPQHLLTRASKNHRIFFIEEPVYENIESPSFTEHFYNENKIIVITPHLPNTNGFHPEDIIKKFLAELVFKYRIKNYITWFYTPMAQPYAAALKPQLVVYDCMDELSCFAGAHPDLKKREKDLLTAADVVFTGGRCLYEFKKNHHKNIYCFPSSIDKKHFSKAKKNVDEPEDQLNIPHPRIGYFGVVDERMDINLIDELSKEKPDWHFILLGPVVKIDPAILPQRKNLHFLGKKSYEELPVYISGWDVAFLPFAKNDSTRFISPTKTPEYLAAGKPVVSTSITDVVTPYGENKFASIADTPADFINAIQEYLSIGIDEKVQKRIDQFLNSNSWDKTWGEMYDLIKKEFQTIEEYAKKVNKVFVRE